MPVDAHLAESIARAALGRAPRSAALQHIRGEALARLGRFAEAEQALCIAVATDGRLAELRAGGGAPYTRRP